MAKDLKIFTTTCSEVYTGNDVVMVLNEVLSRYATRKIFLLVDENTLQHCVPLLITKIKVLEHAEIIEIESGEENKTIDICYQIWKTMADYEADRSSLLINLGGGVITDMGGFIASTFKRGIDFVNVPTTLLSQIDASVGGKTGVDLDGLKNMIGVFNEPIGVFVYPEFLKTLDKRQMLSGYAEALKHALIADADYWSDLRSGMLSNEKSWGELINRSIDIKNNIVLKDPKEKKERKLLNFGHTIGHAVETCSLKTDAPLLHGEAVAVGMIAESYLSHQMAGLSEDGLKEIVETINSFYKLNSIDSNKYHNLLELMKNDKKNSDDQINFTLLNEIGEATVDYLIGFEEIIDALNYYNSVL